MYNYDNWKTMSPEDEEILECPECGGVGRERYDGYCSKTCKNFDD